MTYHWIVGKKGKLDATAVEISGSPYCYSIHAENSFCKDNVLLDNASWFLLLEGVILNRSELMRDQDCSWSDYVEEMVQQHGIRFLDLLRGSFCGVLIDKRSCSCKAFVDQLGERPVFYTYDGVVSTSIDLLTNNLRERGISYSPDIEGTNRFLYFGYMVDGKTHIAEITRVFPGNYYDLDEGKEYPYFRFTNEQTLNLSEEDLIEKIDESFRRALRREFDKDLEYGRKHLVDLSGGLDARVINYVARDMGYESLTNIVYSQANAYERKVAERIAGDLGNNYLFYALDNAEFLWDVDEIVASNFGLSYYAGITGGNRMLKCLNPNEFCVEHTGLLGDVYEGSFSTEAKYEKPFINPRYRFSKLDGLKIDDSFLQLYPENELFGFYTRGLLGGVCTNMIRRQYFETYSPFEDVDWLQLMFAIPLKERIDNQIYMKWVQKKYPAAFRIPYARTMCRPGSSKLHVVLKSYPYHAANKYLLPILARLGMDIETNSRLTMNPFEYWNDNNAALRTFVAQYIKDNKDRLSGIPQLLDYANTVENVGNLLDKTVLMTALAVYRRYF